ncbi:MAG: CPBP family intramembrane metalloprotease [Eubacterium sp.]|nr:CPBP family intramembrane metalloprotease [Eubacterium sp.]
MDTYNTYDTYETNTSNNTNEIRKVFNWIGLSYFVFMVVEIGASFLLSFILKSMNISGLNSWATYILGLAPIWAFGFPVCYLMLRKVPAKRPADEVMKPKYLVQFYLMLTFMMIGGSIIGNMISYVLENGVGIIIKNDTIDLISKQKILPSIIFAVILGPILEELAFRKLLLDRVSGYSKKYTIILSGIMFGLIHTNLYQFFYAFFIGMVFAYIYTITGKLRYSVILHMTVNFIHGILPMIFLKHIDTDEALELSTMDKTNPAYTQKMTQLLSNPYMLSYVLYIIILLIFVVAGIIIFALNHRQLKVNDSQSPLQKPEAVPAIFYNLGMILFFIITIGYSIFEIVLMN